jgi:hypothetical protein
MYVPDASDCATPEIYNSPMLYHLAGRITARMNISGLDGYVTPGTRASKSRSQQKFLDNLGRLACGQPGGWLVVAVAHV